MYCLSAVPHVVVADSLEEWGPDEELSALSAVVVHDPTVSALHPEIRTSLLELFGRVTFEAITETEPSASAVEATADAVAAAEPEVVISVGGGSTIDTAKGACFLTLSRDHLPTTFQSPGTFQRVLPHVTIPTTAGPGAEASPAMVYTTTQRSKTTLVDDRLIPRTIVVVPELATTLPPFETACCVFDGIAHSLEGLWQPSPPALGCMLARSSVHSFMSALPQVLREPSDRSVREALAVASVVSATGLRLTGVGAPHALAGQLGRLVDYPHGGLVAASLLAVLHDEIESGVSVDQLASSSAAAGTSSLDGLHSQLLDLFHADIVGRRGCRTTSATEGEIRSCARGVRADPRLVSHPTPIDPTSVERLFHTAMGYLYADGLDT